jgi:hypothetical protein
MKIKVETFSVSQHTRHCLREADRTRPRPVRREACRHRVRAPVGARAGAHTTLRYTPSRHETAQREPCPATACSLTPHTADSSQLVLPYALAHTSHSRRAKPETRSGNGKRSRYYICLHPANQQYTVRLTNNQQVPCLSVRHRSRGIIRHLIAVRRRCPAALRLPEVA